MVLGLNEVHISLLRMMLQIQILVKASAKPPGAGKLAGAIQWTVSTLGEDQLPFKVTAAIFSCIPEPAELLPGLDSSVLTEFKGSAMESDILSAGDLGQETKTDTEASYVSTTEADMETDAEAKQPEQRCESRRKKMEKLWTVIFLNFVILLAK